MVSQAHFRSSPVDIVRSVRKIWPLCKHAGPLAFQYSLLLLKNIKMICRHTQSYLTQAGRDEKCGFVPYKIYLFIKVFALTADR